MFEVSDAYKTAITKQSRRFKLSGEIRLKSGTAVDITDSNVIGELSVSTQMMSGSRYDDTIDIGAITSAVLSMSLRDDSSANSFADARVRLLVGLELEDGTYEYVKMGIFYIDSPSIQRVKNIISFTAYDKMIFLPLGFTDENGIANYRYSDGKIVPRTAEDKADELANLAVTREIGELKAALAATDYIAAKIAEGAATREEYAEQIAQRAGWRARINELEGTT